MSKKGKREKEDPKHEKESSIGRLSISYEEAKKSGNSKQATMLKKIIDCLRSRKENL